MKCVKVLSDFIPSAGGQNPTVSIHQCIHLFMHAEDVFHGSTNNCRIDHTSSQWKCDAGRMFALSIFKSIFIFAVRENTCTTFPLRMSDFHWTTVFFLSRNTHTFAYYNYIAFRKTGGGGDQTAQPLWSKDISLPVELYMGDILAL